MPKCKLRFEMFTAGLLLLGSLPAGAQSSVWDGSYAADGRCYCSGNQSPKIDSQIIPTPIGGQSVKQICERIGTGPTLSKTDDDFNYSVYVGPQCGHGPVPDGINVKEGQKPGPKWDLASLYSPSGKNEVAKPGVSDSLILTSGPRYIVPNKSSASNKPAIKSESVAKAESGPDQSAAVAKSTTINKAAHVETKVAAPVENSTKPTNDSLKARLAANMEAARERARLKELENQRIADGLAARKQAEKSASAKIESDNADSASAQIGTAKIAISEVETAKVEANGSDAPVVQVKPAQQKQIADSNSTGSESVESKREDLKAALDVAKESDSANAPFLAALKLPNQVRGSSREFNFVQAQPINFDFGGAGLNVAASASSHGRMQYYLDASVADTYREVRAGVGYYVTPAKADRLTFLVNLGLESGQFEFSGSGFITNHADTGAYIGASSRLVVNNKFELQAGVGYSSFFEGDAKAFGAALFHLNKDVDLTGTVKLGDNDSVGFGVRFYY